VAETFFFDGSHLAVRATAAYSIGV